MAAGMEFIVCYAILSPNVGSLDGNDYWVPGWLFIQDYIYANDSVK
jgi:hypothetical protein